MKKQILITLVLFAVLASSCREDEVVRYYELTEAEKQLIPYTLGQTVNFIDSTGQTFYAVVTKDTMYWQERHYDGFPDLYAHENCRKVVLQSDSADFNINISINAKNKSIRIEISHLDLVFFLKYNNEGKFVSREPDAVSGQYLHNILKIGSQTYYDVVEENRYNTRSIFYNKTYGILQVTDKGKVLFTINN